MTSMKFRCDKCGQEYSLVNEDHERDNRVTPEDVVVPDAIYHRCPRADGKWRVMKRA